MKDAATTAMWTMTFAGFVTIVVGGFMSSGQLILLGLAVLYLSGLAATIISDMNCSEEQ